MKIGILGLVALLAQASFAQTYVIKGPGAEFLSHHGFSECDPNGCTVSDDEYSLMSDGSIVVALSDSTYGPNHKPMHFALRMVRFLVEKDLYGKNKVIACITHKVQTLAIENHYVCSFEGTLETIK